MANHCGRTNSVVHQIQVLLVVMTVIATIGIFFVTKTFQLSRKGSLRFRPLFKLGISPTPRALLPTPNTLFNSSFLDLLPRSAYFDDRPRDGHNNATVILVQVLKTILKSKRVIQCGVDDHVTQKMKIKSLGIFRWVHKRHPSLTHDDAMITCYDLPAHQGSRVFVFYRDKSGNVFRLETEKRLYIPFKNSSGDGRTSGPSVVVCTTMYGTPPWLREWLLYQKTIGVDFIHINAQESFITSGAANNSVLQTYLESGYAKLDVWKKYLGNSRIFYYGQPLLYVDCLYRHLNVFDYAFFGDSDDFFTPVIPGKTDIHYYVEKLFKNKKVASVRFLWYTFYPDCGLTKNLDMIKDGNVTQHLKVSKHKTTNNFKSMHKTAALVENGIHKVMETLPNYIQKTAPKSVAYVAHLRKRETTEVCQS